MTACDWHPSLDEATLTLQVRRSGTRRYRPIPLTVTEFIRRWLQHVLPVGLHRVRYYGFLHPHSKYSLQLVRWLISIATDRLYELACTVVEVNPPSSRLVCPSCGGWMVFLAYTLMQFVSDEPDRSVEQQQIHLRSLECLSLPTHEPQLVVRQDDGRLRPVDLETRLTPLKTRIPQLTALTLPTIQQMTCSA